MHLRRVRIHRTAVTTAVYACALACALSVGVGGLGVGPFRALAGATAPPHATGTETAEYQVKSVLLLKLAYYTDWPKKAFEEPESPLVVAVVGKDPFGKWLERTFERKEIDEREIVVRRYKTAKDIKEAHIMVLGGMSSKERKACIAKIKGRPVLVVADSGGVLSTGASVGFFLEGKNVKFEVAPHALKASGLRISSRALKHARVVRKPKVEGGKK